MNDNGNSSADEPISDARVRAFGEAVEEITRVIMAARKSSPPPPPAASPLPAAPLRADVGARVEGDDVHFTLGDRSYRARGLSKCTSPEILKVNLLVRRDALFHVDTLDLYSARQRQVFTRLAAEELELGEEVLKKDIGKVLLKLEEIQEEQIRKALEPKVKRVEMSDTERHEALALLKDPDLMKRIVADFERCGLVGETTNKLVAYLATVSRKLAKPLAILVQSSSAAGKTQLMDAVLAFVPEEDRVKYSAMTGQSLFYMGEEDLRHKVLAIVEEEGASRASYPLKLLQSEGEISIASTGKDPHTGEFKVKRYQVVGPVMPFMTSTSAQIDEELLNRFLVLTVNEDREQTRAIHRFQREQETLEGLMAELDTEGIVKLHQNAQRLLEPIAVMNPYARELTFLDDRTRTRRDHKKYLTLIKAVALLFQFQRPRKSFVRNGREVEYIEVTLADIAIANKLAHEVLGRSLGELTAQQRRLLDVIEAMVVEECRAKEMERQDGRFTARQLRERIHWSYEQVRVHLNRLVELEYVLVHRAPRGQSYVYELVYDGGGKDGKPFVVGLIDVATLGQKASTPSTSGPDRGGLGVKTGGLGGEKGHLGGSSKGHPAPILGPSWGGSDRGNGTPSEGSSGSSPDRAEKALLGAARADKPEGRRNGEPRPRGSRPR